MNQVVLVTGGSRGLGANTALALAKQGFDVVITYQANEQAALKVVEEIRNIGQKAEAMVLDVGIANAFGAFAQELQTLLATRFDTKQLHGLVNNAGMGMNHLVADMEEEVFDELYRVHVKGSYFLTQALLPLFSEGSSIVNISSGLARFSFPGYSAYAMMKGAVEVMTRYMAKEFGSQGIRVNTFAPGAIETDFRGGEVRDNKQVNQLIASVTALGRAGVPDDIGGAIAFLMTDASRWVNAQRIEASGGMFV